MRKKIGLLSLIFVLILSFSLKAYASEEESVLHGTSDELETLEALINEGNEITDDSSPEAFAWVTKVLNCNENYKQSFVYADIKKECNSAKGHSNIDLLNEKNKIIGYIACLIDEINGISNKNIELLIETGNSLDNDDGSAAFTWIIDVMKLNNRYSPNSVSNEIKAECESAKGHLRINLLNEKNKILGYLSILKDEIPISSELQSLNVLNNPYKTEYEDGETFDPKGLKVNAIFKNTYGNEDVKEEAIEITNFKIDKSVLHCDDTKVTITYKDGDITKTADINITVKPILLSRELKSIRIEKAPEKTVYKIGETFNSYGMKVNAIYSRSWSNGITDTETVENIAFSVDQTRKFEADDKFVTVSYVDGAIEKTVRLNITIKQSYKVIITATAESDKYYAETDQPSYYEGETVHLYYGAEDGYYINKVEIDGENIDRLYIGYDFVMPAHDVVVKLYVSDQYDEGDSIPYPDDPSVSIGGETITAVDYPDVITIKSNQNIRYYTIKMVKKGKYHLKELSKDSTEYNCTNTNKSIVSLSSKGILKAKNEGVTTLTVTKGNIKYVCNISVTAPYYEKKIYELNVGDVINAPLKGTDLSIVYSAKKPNVITVSGNVIKAVSYGNSILTARMIGDAAYKCKIKVYDPMIIGSESVVKGTASKYKIKNGAKKTLWSIDDPNIATVDEKGKVTGLSDGKTIIRAINNGKEISMLIEVK